MTQDSILNHLKEVAKILASNGFEIDINEDEFTDITRDSYLLRYGEVEEGEDEWSRVLVVMGDLGVTWEPARAYQTECYGFIGGKDPQADAATLAEIAHRPDQPKSPKYCMSIEVDFEHPAAEQTSE